MGRLSLGDLLTFIPSNEVARTFSRAGLSGAARKTRRIELLRAACAQSGLSAGQVLEFFSAESLRRVATRFGIRAATKESYIAGLVAALTEPFPPPPQSVARSIESIRDFVVSLAGSYRNSASEADAELYLASALSDQFAKVRTQAPVPDHFGHRIDIDIQDGQFGLEVKWAGAVIESPSEAYRLLGQALYYDRRRYAGRLLVVIVGPEKMQQHPVIAEVSDLLDVLGVARLYLSIYAS